MAELADFVLPHTEERHAAYVEGELEQLLGELSADPEGTQPMEGATFTEEEVAAVGHSFLASLGSLLDDGREGKRDDTAGGGGGGGGESGGGGGESGTTSGSEVGEREL